MKEQLINKNSKLCKLHLLESDKKELDKIEYIIQKLEALDDSVFDLHTKSRELYLHTFSDQVEQNHIVTENTKTNAMCFVVPKVVE